MTGEWRGPAGCFAASGLCLRLTVRYKPLYETGTVDTKKGYRGLNGAAPVTSSRPEPLLGWCTAPSTDRLCLLQVLHAVSWASCSDPSECSPVALVASFEHSAYQVDLGVCIYDPVLNLVSHNFRISSVLVEIWM